MIAYTVIHPDGTEVQGAFDEQASFSGVMRPKLAEIIGEEVEHVGVLHNNRAADMFVGELSAINGSTFNTAATAIYRNYTLTNRPEVKAHTLPAIYGIAVIFSRRVYF